MTKVVLISLYYFEVKKYIFLRLIFCLFMTLRRTKTTSLVWIRVRVILWFSLSVTGLTKISNKIIKLSRTVRKRTSKYWRKKSLIYLSMVVSSTVILWTTHRTIFV